MNNIHRWFKSVNFAQTGQERFDIYEVASFGNLKRLVFKELFKNRRLEHPAGIADSGGLRY